MENKSLYIYNKDNKTTQQMNGRNVSVGQVSKITGLCPQFIRTAIQNKEFPIGKAIRNKRSGRYTYYISNKEVFEMTGVTVLIDSNRRGL